MNEQAQASQLIQELLADPDGFAAEGRAYALLQEYFRGYPLETLVPLMQHSNTLVRRSATFVASELGGQAAPLVKVISPLTNDPDLHTRWYAIESVMLGSEASNHDEFIHVIRQLDSEDSPIRRLLMGLLCNANHAQLAGALASSYRLVSNRLLHEQGLRLLLAEATAETAQLTDFIDSPHAVARVYGAVASKRLSSGRPELLERAAQSADPDIAKFATEALG